MYAELYLSDTVSLPPVLSQHYFIWSVVYDQLSLDDVTTLQRGLMSSNVLENVFLHTRFSLSRILRNPEFFLCWTAVNSVFWIFSVEGFSTAKGELVRSILFPKPVDFKFSQDAFKFIGVLALIAMVGMIYTIVLMVSSYPFMSLLCDVIFKCQRKHSLYHKIYTCTLM